MAAGGAAADRADEHAGLDPGAAETGRLDDDAVDRVVVGLLAAAERTDRADRLPVEHFAAFADLGLFGMAVPADRGGLGLAPTQIRHVLRRLGSGCGATAFAFAQHHGTAATVAGSANGCLVERVLPGLADRVLAGIAYAHVRRPGPPVLVAEPARGGSSDHWVLSGTAPWVTSWGLADEFGVAALTEDGRLVWALVPAAEGPGLALGQRFELSVFGATATVALHFDHYRVEAERLIDVVDVSPWAERDRHLAARPNPLCLGIGDRALAMLAEVEPAAAEGLASSWVELGERAEEASSAVDRGVSDLTEVAAVRAEVVLATQNLTAALLAAVGGRGMERGHPAQRLHREAGFYVVQAQNDVGRSALLSAVARRL